MGRQTLGDWALDSRETAMGRACPHQGSGRCLRRGEV